MAATNDSADFAKAFGEAVRRERERQGLSQEAFGFRAGLDRTYVSGVERCVRNTALRVIVQICEALGVGSSKLMRRAESKR